MQAGQPLGGGDQLVQVDRRQRDDRCEPDAAGRATTQPQPERRAQRQARARRRRSRSLAIAEEPVLHDRLVALAQRERPQHGHVGIRRVVTCSADCSRWTAWRRCAATGRLNHQHLDRRPRASSGSSRHGDQPTAAPRRSRRAATLPAAARAPAAGLRRAASRRRRATEPGQERRGTRRCSARRSANATVLSATAGACSQPLMA